MVKLENTIRLNSRRFLEGTFHRFSRHLDGDFLNRSAIVFAPHQDDEVLACGGTIIKKIKSGTNVKIVFLTDGRKSHWRLISQEKLKAVRKNEALEAAKTLGLREEDVIFLDYPERELRKNVPDAVQKTCEILKTYSPHEVFMPYAHEGNDDHMAANEILRQALYQINCPAAVFEYPIWFLNNWPWVPKRLNGRRNFPSHFKKAIVASVRFLKDFHTDVFVGDALELKVKALNKYSSQMTRLINSPRWAILADVSDGEFLRLFLRDYEVYRNLSDRQMPPG